MNKRTLTLKQWQTELGDSTPLDQVPDELSLTPREVGLAVKSGQLKIQTFRAHNGQTFRRVRRRDLKILKMTLRPPSIRDFARAFEQMMDRAG